jgi:riboflavin synthase
LTIAEKKGNELTLVLIPETLKRTALARKKTGDPVNIEVDCMAKYVESLLQAQKSGLTESKLREYGF